MDQALKYDYSQTQYTEEVGKMSYAEKAYIKLVGYLVWGGGDDKSYRTRNSRDCTVSMFLYPPEIDLTESRIPLLITSRMDYRSIFKELCWILSGSTNTNILECDGVTKWSVYSEEEYLSSQENYLIHFPSRKRGDLGPSYGFHLRHYGARYVDNITDYREQGKDQLSEVIANIKNKPEIKEHFISFHNPSDDELYSVRPRYKSVILTCEGENEMSCLATLGTTNILSEYPYDAVFFSLFVHLICHFTGKHAKSLRMSPSAFEMAEDQSKAARVIIDKEVIVQKENDMSVLSNRDPREAVLEISAFATKNISELSPEQLLVFDYNPAWD